VALTNITDYGGNQSFVRYVLSMNTIYGNPDVAYRAITAHWLWTLSYPGIIAGEVLTAMQMAWAAFGMS
jgi:predicted small integral membrane protein